MIAIKTTIEVSTAVLGDIAITAAEGGLQGIGGWAQIDSYRPSRWTDDDGPLTVPEDFVFYTILVESGGDWDWADPEAQRFDITPELIARGIGVFLRQGHFADPTDLAAMDANEADLVIQYGCFGEQVYG